METKRAVSKLTFGVGVLIAAAIAIAGCNIVPPGDGVGVPLDEDVTVAGQPGGRITLMLQGTRPAADSPSAAVRSVAPRAVTPVEIAVTAADGSAQGTITLTDARISLKDFKFKRPESDLDEEGDDEENESVKLEGPFIVDLLTDVVTPEIPPVDVVAGTYTALEVKINKIEDEPEDEDEAGDPLLDASDPMFGYSIYLAGTYTGSLSGQSVTDVPFTMAFDLDEEVEIAAGDPSLGFVINEDMLHTVILAFRVVQWFDFTDTEANSDELDFDDLVDTAAVNLDESVSGVAEDVRDVIKKKIEKSADTGKDADDDGRLDSDEDDDPDEQDVEDGTGEDGEDDEA